MEWQQLWPAVIQGGGAVLLLLAVVTSLISGKLVPGNMHRQMLKERDDALAYERQRASDALALERRETNDWKVMALGSVDTGAKLMEIAQRRRLDVSP